MSIGQIGAIGRLGLAQTKGEPLRRTINGVLCERVSLDGEWLMIDGQPVYMEI